MQTVSKFDVFVAGVVIITIIRKTSQVSNRCKGNSNVDIFICAIRGLQS